MRPGQSVAGCRLQLGGCSAPAGLWSCFCYHFSEAACRGARGLAGALVHPGVTFLSLAAGGVGLVALHPCAMLRPCAMQLSLAPLRCGFATLQ